MQKTVLITGASSGIGRATAVKLSEFGYPLILCGRREDRLQALKAELSGKTKVHILKFDVRDKKEVQHQINSLPDEWKSIEILINSAGNAHGLSSIQAGDTEDWDAMMDGNVKGLLYVSRSILPSMVERKCGHVINISSVAGKQTYANGAVYCASKSAVESISEGMRMDLTEHGIKVTNIAPGAVKTEFSEVRFKGDKERAKKVYEGFEPLLPEDVADMIAYVIHVPERVTIGDVVMYAKNQSGPTTIFRNKSIS